ncbi:MAG: aromatic ring-hydroxylating dioxygenase subunit alpha [Candidatus Binatia bacterium]
MTMLRDIFSDAEIEAMRRPLDEAVPPPPQYYTSKEMYELEVRHIFMKEWLWVGHVEQLTKPGDYFTFTIVDEPILVLRDQANQVRAYSAVCRHRGAVIATGEGNCKAFTCPYHGWTYGLDGRLIGAPHMQEVKSFDAARYGLIPLKVETWEGSILVNFDPLSKPLADSLGNLPDFAKNFRMGEMVSTERRIYDFECNWKMLVENYAEAYHVANTHGDTPGYSDVRYWSTVEPRGRHDEILVGEFQDAMVTNVAGSSSQPSYIIEGLTERERRTQNYLLLLPNWGWSLQANGMICFVMVPNGPDRSQFIMDWHFPKALVESPDFPQIAKESYDGVDGFNAQDMRVLALAFKGYQSRLFRPGRFSLHEPIPYRFSHYILDRIAGENGFGR